MHSNPPKYYPNCRAKRNATSVCGEDCPNLNETAGMRLRMNIQANKIQQMSADLSAAQQESSDLLTTLESLQNEVKKLNEQNDYFAGENSRLRESFDELLEMRTKLAAIKRVGFDSPHSSDLPTIFRSEMNSKFFCPRVTLLRPKRNCWQKRTKHW